VALQVDLDGGVVDQARLVLGGVAPVPWRAREAEAVLQGEHLTETVIQNAAVQATVGARPLSKNAFKVELVQGLVREALQGLV
jgi:xanthine dehydrogenase YagS FAD-binding subunit